MVTIAGRLEDPLGNAIAECQIELITKKNGSAVLVRTSATSSPDGAGNYTMNVKPGMYAVRLIADGCPPNYIGDIKIYSDSKSGTLNDFLLNPEESEITSALLAQVTEERKQAQTAAQSAQKSATQASSTLTNVVKKTGDTMSGPLSINTNNNSYFELIESSDKRMRLFINNDNGGIGFSGSDSVFPTTRLRFIQSNTTWNFENSSVNINNQPVMKQGDYGIGGGVIDIGYGSFDDLTRKTGTYWYSTRTTGEKPTFYGVMLHLNADTNTGFGQLIFDYESSNVYVRSARQGKIREVNKIITTANISENNILKKGDYGLGAETAKNQVGIDIDKFNFATGFFSGNNWKASVNGFPFKAKEGILDWAYLFNQNLASVGNKYKLQILGAAHEQRLAFRNWVNGLAKPFIEFITTANSTIDANGFYKKASPICRLFGDNNTPEVDGFTKSGCGLVNNEACGIEAKRIDVGHYEIHGSLGFAKEGWYITLPEDANGNKKIFAEYTTDENNVITVKTFTRKFDIERCEIVAGEPIDITAERWIDVRLEMPVQEMTESHL